MADGQPQAAVLLARAASNPSHAYLLFGPRGSGKDDAARALCAAVLATEQRRVDEETHPDLFVVEPEGEAILIDQIRALRADLHLRPFEAERRAYLIREAETMGRDAANALLKSLEEPPEYATFVLVCNDRARLLPTIESRCQRVPFRTPAPAEIAAALGGDADAVACARLARGNLDLARRLHGDPAARARQIRVLDLARDAFGSPVFDPGDAAKEIVEVARTAGEAASAEVDARAASALDRLGDGAANRRERARLTRVFEALAKRRRRRAETDELRAAVDAVLGFYRDVLFVSIGLADRVISSERLDELRSIADRLGQAGAEAVIAELQDVRRTLDLPVIPALATERLFHEIALRAQGPSV